MTAAPTVPGPTSAAPAPGGAPLTFGEPDGIAPRGTVIVLPGRGESPPVYTRLGRRLAADAWRVVVLDSGAWHAGPLEAARLALSDPGSPEPKVLLGSDTGARAALEVAARVTGGPHAPAALVLAGLPTGRAGSPAFEGSWEAEVQARTACPNHRRVLAAAAGPAAQAPWQGTGQGTLAAVLDVPVLAVHGENDRISPVGAAVAEYRAVGAAEVLVVDGGLHDVLNDVAHRTVASSIVLFLERLRLQGSAGGPPALIAVPMPMTAVADQAAREPAERVPPLPPDLPLHVLAATGVPVERGVDARDAVRTDRSGWEPGGRPEAVVRARTIDDVVQTLRWASAAAVPVVPRGGGSGVTGAAAAGAGQVVLDLTGMNRIVSLDAGDGTAVVEPGVLTADLDRAAAAHGLRYAPDPASWEISTIGGNIATNAGGLRCTKYGVTRDAVLWLDVILADGSLLRTGTGSLRGVTGYDLTSLFVGSEGTLGVVVGAGVRLQRRPVATATVAAYFGDVATAATAAAQVVGSGVRAAMLEIVDGATLRAVDDFAGGADAARGDALLLAQTDGWSAEAEAEAVAALVAERAVSVEVTLDPSRGSDLVAARRLALTAVERRGRVLVEDVAVPRPALAAAVSGISAISQRTGVPVFSFAHAGDGIVHPLVLDEGDRRAVRETVDAIVALALGLGGTLSGEHGIGALKRQWLDSALSPTARSVLTSIKTALDPQGILNPGKAV